MKNVFFALLALNTIFVLGLDIHLNDDQVIVSFESADEARYAIQTSENLVDWRDTEFFCDRGCTSLEGTFQISQSTPRAFFRIVDLDTPLLANPPNDSAVFPFFEGVNLSPLSSDPNSEEFSDLFADTSNGEPALSTDIELEQEEEPAWDPRYDPYIDPFYSGLENENADAVFDPFYDPIFFEGDNNPFGSNNYDPYTSPFYDPNQDLYPFIDTNVGENPYEDVFHYDEWMEEL